MENQNVKEQKEVQKKEKLSVENIVGIVLIAVFLPVIIYNMIVVVKGWMNPDKIPTALGFAPLVVDSPSMTKDKRASYGGAFNEGDIIIMGKVDVDKLELLDIITYNQINSLGKMETVTHRITNILDIKTDCYEPSIKNYEDAVAAFNVAKEEYEKAKKIYDDANAVEGDERVDDTLLAEYKTNMDSKKSTMDRAEKDVKDTENVMNGWKAELEKGTRIFQTQGDFDSPAVVNVFEYEVQGKYLFRLPLIGKLILTEENRIIGSIVLILVPVGGYFAYELIKKAKSSKKSDEKIAELEAKLAAQEQAKQEQPKEEVQEQPEESQEDSAQ